MSAKKAPENYKRVNYTDAERTLFASIISQAKFKEIIECKVTNGVTNKQKNEAWAAITVQFNATTTYVHRSENSLKNLWDNMKRVAKQGLSSEKQERMVTGGGPMLVFPQNNVQDTVLGVLGNAATGLESDIDGDAAASHLLKPLRDNLQGISSVQVVSMEGENSSSSPITNDALKEALSNLQVGADWGDFKTSMLYHPKAPELKVSPQTAAASSLCSPSTSAGASASGSSAPSSSPAGVKRSPAEEAQHVKNMKRRRPSLPTDPKKDSLVEAKLALTLATQQNMELNRRNLERDLLHKDSMYDLEKKKKEMEVMMMELQLKKMRQEMGID